MTNTFIKGVEADALMACEVCPVEFIKQDRGKEVRTMQVLKQAWKDFWLDESGMGVVEIILIIVVLIAMVIIFKEQITELVNNIWKSINESAKKIY